MSSLIDITNTETAYAYLEDVVKLLNKECISNKTPNNDGYYNFTSYEWDIDDLSIDISECKKDCYLENEYSCYEHRGLCENCKSILEDKIRKPFNKTLLELNIETNTINLKIDLLSKKIDMILEKLNDYIENQ
jgi:hypothetical protein